MTYRRRLTLIVAVSVGVAITIAAVVAYVAAASELHRQIDGQLRDQARLASDLGPPPGALSEGQSGDESGGGLPPLPGEPGEAQAAPTDRVSGQLRLPPPSGSDLGQPSFARLVDAQGDVIGSRGTSSLPVPDAAEVKAVSDGEARLSDFEGDGDHLRVITAPAQDGRVVQIARPLTSIDEVLSNLSTVLFLVTMVGIAISALVARLIAGRMLAPVNRLTAAAEHVSATEDLSSRIEVSGEDEIAQLASRFNTMLGRLERSRSALDSAHEDQRRLIADASHELRTPVTALRTNIELLSHEGALPPEDRSRVLVAALSQAEELGALIGDLMDLARGEAPSDQQEPETVRLDELASEAVARARTHAPGVEFVFRAEPSLVDVSPERIARALNNLLDNAAAHSDGGAVEVTVEPGVVSVRDHGEGLRPEEADRVFDRFYRGRDGRSRPGSGLGLAIVRQVAKAHGGSVSARSAPGNGALFELRLPISAP